jgi:type IV secretory pathway TrbD component
MKFCQIYSQWTTTADLLTALLGSVLAVVAIIVLRKDLKKDFIIKAMFILVSSNIGICLLNLKMRTRCMEKFAFGFPEGNIFFLLFVVMPIWLVGFGISIWIIKRCLTNTKLGI